MPFTRRRCGHRGSVRTDTTAEFLHLGAIRFCLPMGTVYQICVFCQSFFKACLNHCENPLKFIGKAVIMAAQIIIYKTPRQRMCALPPAADKGKITARLKMSAKENVINNEARKGTQALPKAVRCVGADDLTLPPFENQYPASSRGV